MTAVDRLSSADPYAHLSSLELIRNNISTKRIEIIPMSGVQIEQAIVDLGHAQDLADSMSKERGQITPITTRAREDGQIVYDVIDGFHRSAARKLMGAPDIYSVVVYNCPDDELYDLRILAASSVKSVQFPRIAEWMTQSYASSEWPSRGLSITQAFGLAISGSLTSRVASLGQADVAELRQWVKDRCKRWQKSPAAALSILRLVESADPELIKQVRISAGGKDRNGKITPARLQAVVTRFPGQENFRIQNEVLNFVVDNRLSAAETGFLVQGLSPFLKADLDESAIREVLGRVNIEKLLSLMNDRSGDEEEEPEFTESEEEIDPEELALVGPTPSEEDEPDPEEMMALEQELQERGDAVIEEIPLHSVSRQPSRGGFGKVRMSENGGSSYRTDPDTREEIKTLKKSLQLAHAIGGSSSDRWYLTDPNLPRDEREVMIALYLKAENPIDAAERLGMTPNRVIQLSLSAWTRRHHEVGSLKIATANGAG